MSEPTDQEMWAAIAEDSKKKDKKILELEEKLNKLMEVKNEKEEKGGSLAGYYSSCGESLTQEEIKGQSCPKCGSRKFNTYPR